MQILKEDIKSEILRQARREFREKGYRGANLREIARAAGMTVGNIYRYFGSKDELFRDLLAPIIGNIEMMKLGLKRHETSEMDSQTEKAEHEQMVMVVYGFIQKYREDLKLLLTRSGGSSLENYQEELIRWYGGLYRQSLEESWQQMGKDKLQISEITVNLVARSVADSIIECIMREYSVEEVKKIAEELFSFYGGGSQAMLLSKVIGDVMI